MTIAEQYLRNLVEEIVRETLNEELSNAKREDSHLLCEMANVGAGRWGKKVYKLIVHGPLSGDRKTPHLYIYEYTERNTRNPRFNFEISIEGIVTKNDLILSLQKDKENNLLQTHRNKCSWTGYSDLKKDLEDYLKANSETPLFGKTVSNLQMAIYGWNHETDKVINGCIEQQKKQNLKGQMGTTPRVYRDLLASLMDLTSGSGDRATPVVLIQNYF